MRRAIEVANNELKRVFAGTKIDAYFGLPGAKILVLAIGRGRAAVILEFLIDQQMMMGGVFFLSAGRHDA